MKILNYLIFCWKQRNTPWYDMAEEYSLLTKMARRCAYDLCHAVDYLPPGFMRDSLKDAPKMWLSIFAPDGVKDYRHSLYHEIDKAERRVEKLRDFCIANNLDPDTIDETPPF